MSFPWPAIDEEAIFEQALGIALRYFDLPRDEAEYADVESRAGHAIMEQWQRAVRNKAVLANKAIAEIKEHHSLGKRLRRAS